MATSIIVRHGGDAAHGAGEERNQTRPHPTATRIAVSFLICFLPPLFAYHSLGGGGPVAWILEYLVVTEVLALVGAFSRVRTSHGTTGTVPSADARRANARGYSRRGLGGDGIHGFRRFTRRLSSWLHAGLFVFGAVVVFVSIDITPASAFLAWFALVVHGGGGGTIAFMFVVVFSLFSAIFADGALRWDTLFAACGLLAVDLFLWGIIHEQHVLAVAGAVLFISALIYAGRHRVGRMGSRTAVAVVQVTLVAALASWPVSAAIGQNSLIDGLFSLRLDSTVAELFPSFPFMYSVPGYGSSFSSTALGRRPDLTSHPVFAVSGPAGATIYLRTGVYDLYTGRGWLLSSYEKRRGYFASYFYDYRPRDLPQSSTQTISVKLLADFYQRLPNTLDTIGFEFPNRPTPPLAYGSLDSGFLLDSPMTKGAVVTDVIDASPLPTSSRIFNRNLPGFGGQHGLYVHDGRRSAAFIRRQESWSASLPIGIRGASALPSRYSISSKEFQIDLQTGKLPNAVHDLAVRLKRSTESQTVRAIQDYLENNYLYSLNTRAAGPAGDTVDDFLFHSRTGYCVQFATAFVILARLDGIPARYVTGFLVYLPSDGTRTTVTGLSAHAWAEIWNPSTGWNTVEATPPMLASSFSDPQFYIHFNPTDSGATRRELEAVLGNRVAIQAAQTHRSGRGAVESPRKRDALLAATGGTLFVGLATLLIVFLLRRLAPVDVRLSRLVARIARTSNTLHLPDPGRSGWTGWARGVCERYLVQRAVVLRVQWIILGRCFGAAVPCSASQTQRDLRFLDLFYRQTFGTLRTTAADMAMAIRRALQEFILRDSE